MAAHLANFKEAMHHVYGGDMDTTTTDWTPPSLSSSSSSGRHLYTDAIAVINYITLSKLSLSSPSPAEADIAKGRAKLLIDSVHDTLGRTQDGSRRLNGASDGEPLKGGLRSGTLLEGDADGQSHRDLMLWIFALNRYSILTKDHSYNDLAIQLAKAIVPHFVKNENGSYKIYSKLSPDLADGTVGGESSLYLDPYDGYTILTLVQKSAEGNSSTLTDEIQVYESILAASSSTSTGSAPSFSSKDPTEIGHALWISHFLKDSNESILKLCQGAFSSLMTLQKTRYFSKDLSERRASSTTAGPYGEFILAMGIRCFDYSKSSAVFEGIADNITLAWGGPDGVPDDNDGENNLGKARDLVAYAAALEPGAFKDGFLDK